MLHLLAVLLILVFVSMSDKGSATKLQPKQRNAAIVHAFRRAGLDMLVRGKWLTAPMWGRYINAYHSLADGTRVTGNNLHDAIRRDPVLKNTDLGSKLNGEGIYFNKVTSTPRLNCYQVRKKGQDRYDPPKKVGEMWTERLYNPFTQRFGLAEQGESSNKKSSSGDDDADPQSTAGTADLHVCVRAIPVVNENLPGDVTPDGYDGNDDDDDADDIFDTSELPEGASIYYVSSEAKKLFNPREGQNVISAIQERMTLCFGVANNDVPLDAVLEGHDVDDTMTETAKCNARIRCHYMAWALKIRLNYMNDLSFTWGDCCNKACHKMADAQVFKISHGETVRKWHALFRLNNQFPVVSKEKRQLPYFLQANWDIAEAIRKYGRENIDTLGRNMMHMYIHDTLIPKMLKDMATGTTKEELLNMYGLKTLCIDTVGKWLIKLGFKYDYVINNYYVDGHEKKETIRYRWKFVDRYLLMERRMFRWIQMTAEEAAVYEGLENDKVFPGSGYRYKGCNPNDDSDDVVDMVEYHVDTLPAFQDIIDASGEKGKYGGWLSVRMQPGERPVICLGQDEAIFKQYIFTKMKWTYRGERRLHPKDEGYGVMISAFESREFGFGYPLTATDLQTVNEYRNRHRNYVDKEAANAILRRTTKMPITFASNPFCQQFEYGASAEGYWNYERMVIQLEDCADILKALHPGIDFVFLFDHSCGHDRGREDGLRATKMNSGYGGAQPKMHKTKIKQTNGYLGPYQRILEVGDEQHMVFQEGDNGPFWMTPQEREDTKISVYDEPHDKAKTKGELLEKIRFSGEDMSGLKSKKVSELQEIARGKGIAVTKRVRKEKVKGWMGKPKGLFQVLWERGFIDTSKNVRTYYSLKGREDQYGNKMPETSLRDMMRNCLDFIEEETLLQTNARKMGERPGHVVVDRTPKCHPELAGEGIEYSWGCAKNFYRRLPLEKKKGKDTFRKSVNEAISRDNLTTKRIRMFSRRAREYIISYKLMSHKQTLTGLDVDLHTNISEAKIEKMVKDFKTHRCALDFDSSFLDLVIKEKKE